MVTEFSGKIAMTDNTRAGAKPVIDTHSLLSHPLRRRLLFELSNHDNPVHLDAPVDGMTGSESAGATTRHDRPPDPNTVKTELHHSHLPKLAAAGWIEYDSETKTIRYESRIETIQSVLQTTGDDLDQLRTAYD
ncbi:DUF7344 domain-containing protein [Natrarchaeobius chitinivorans]|uniref:DUF7344 domain-containing protein n=1 Tax=Natrarchaeobius chitinivorans TaxID=1679083 RepID=A0A3N6LNK2_NATCH|nr:hypothetical protein EA473_21875 [Natrarchaeobius chitinivorans]